MDPGQVFYPEYEGLPNKSANEVGGKHSRVEGPDDQHDGRCWELPGAIGDVFRIEFHRNFELGVDVREISFRRVGQRTPEEERVRKQQDLERRASERRAREERE